MAERITKTLINEVLPWRLTTDETTNYLKPVIDELGLVHSINLPGMILDPIPTSGRDRRRDLEIKVVAERDKISTLVSTGARGFGAPRGRMDIFKEPIYNLSHNKLYKGSSYLGCPNGKSAAASLRFSSSNVGGIYFVGVVPQFRRRGFGEAITWQAVMNGLREGRTLAYLQSSGMGFPGYIGMGFKKFLDYRMWEIG